MIRILLTKKECPFCRTYLSFLPMMNMRLPPEGRIIVIDTTNYEEYGINEHPIINKIKYEGTPTLYLEGVGGSKKAIVVTGMTSKEYAETFLKTLLENEFIF